jgi:ABC-type branched-subunit amino acid transport system permease subunit
MPLSEHEQRMFAEIERQLVADDPRFVARTRRRLTAWSPDVRIRVSGLLGVLGLVGVLALTFDLLFGIAGMALLLTAIVVGAGALSERARTAQRGTPPDGR